MSDFKRLGVSVLFAAGLGAGLPAQAQENDETATPLWSQADAYYDASDMAQAREELLMEGGAQRTWYVALNQLEVQSSDDADSLYWTGQAWYGGDINKLWLKSEGSASLNGDGVEDAEIQALYSRAISPFWDAQVGVRYDLEPDGLAHGVVALQGIAPYWFEVDASAFLSEKGDLTARLEAAYELRLTQRLILEPRIEANLSAQDVDERDLGAGLNDIDAGLRLRYEIKREFAPYIGVEWQSKFGRAADAFEAAGGDPSQAVFVAGLRTWF